MRIQYTAQDGVTPIPVSEDNPLPVAGGGGGGGSVTVTNFPATQPVSGTVSVTGVATAANQATQTTALNAINTDLGAPADAAWSGTGDGNIISILKAIHAQNALMIAALNQIEANTSSS